ncbi:MAG: sensor histidine kinase [Acidobacteriota bacterium]
MTGGRGPLVALGVAAAALAIAVVAVSAIAARTLRQRDEAVRTGTLAGLAHQLEAVLRDSDPEHLASILEGFGRANARNLTGLEVASPQGSLGRWGDVGGSGVYEQQLMLGPGWRGAAGRGGFGPGRGGPPLRVRIAPGPELGSAGALPVVLVAGSIAAALTLLGLAAAASRGLLHREKLAAVEAERERLGAVALAGAGLAHRVRNPLAAIKGTAQLMAADAREGERGRIERIVASAERIEALLGRLLQFARPPETHPEVVDLAEVAREVVVRAGGAVTVETRGSTVVTADREQVESVIEELLANARAFDSQGTLELSVVRGGGWVELSVADRGAGLDVDPVRAFEPYVTGRPDGTGLGLAIVRTLAAANGGEARLEPRQGGGTVAVLRLPAGGE